MSSKDRGEEILRWQNQLEEAFSYNDVVAEQYLAPLIEQEKLAGLHFVERYHGHRILIDSFYDFFVWTLDLASDVIAQRGLPTSQPYYVDCLLRFLTLLRTARSAEILSTSGYPLEGYSLQRNLREQVFALAGVANKLTTLRALGGHDKIPAGKNWSEADRKAFTRAQMDEERRVRQSLLRDNLSEESIEALRSWDRLFHQQVHGSQLTRMVELGRLIQQSRFSVGPVPTEDMDAMYINRSHEIGWMVLRLLPFLQIQEAFGDEWVSKWHLLDESFCLMITALGAMGKKIAPAFFQFIDLRFGFDPNFRYFEDDTANSALVV